MYLINMTNVTEMNDDKFNVKVHIEEIFVPRISVGDRGDYRSRLILCLSVAKSLAAYIS